MLFKIQKIQKGLQNFLLSVSPVTQLHFLEAKKKFPF